MSAEDIRLTGEDDGKRCRNHHLIVIDNGFDLSCGLASSFKDFFEPRMKVIDSLVSEEGACDYETIKARGLTAWDLILRSRKDMEARAFNVNWCDVETAIANVFGINLPEGGIDDEGIMISDNAVSFGTLLDYTFPFRWLKRRFGDADLVNIHGTLDGECIFGIDGSGNLDDRDIPPFTKTYRVLKAARGVPSGSIAYPSQRGGDGYKTSSMSFLDIRSREPIIRTLSLFLARLICITGIPAWSSYTQATLRVFASQRWPRCSPSLITMAPRSVLPNVATTSHTSSCWRAGSSFGRFKPICLCRKWVGSASSRYGMMS